VLLNCVQKLTPRAVPLPFKQSTELVATNATTLATGAAILHNSTIAPRSKYHTVSASNSHTEVPDYPRSRGRRPGAGTGGRCRRTLPRARPSLLIIGNLYFVAKARSSVLSPRTLVRENGTSLFCMRAYADVRAHHQHVKLKSYDLRTNTYH